MGKTHKKKSGISDLKAAGLVVLNEKEKREVRGGKRTSKQRGKKGTNGCGGILPQ